MLLDPLEDAEQPSRSYSPADVEINFSPEEDGLAETPLLHRSQLCFSFSAALRTAKFTLLQDATAAPHAIG